MNEGATVLTRPDQTRPDQTTYVQNSRRKVLLVTIYGNFNYGNILQRLALSRVIETLGFDVVHVCPALVKTPYRFNIKTFIKSKIKFILAVLGVRKYRRQLFYNMMMRKIRSTFSKFQDKHITRRLYAYTAQILASDKSEWAEYDYAVTGSDQVWHNWDGTREELAYFYLSFMPQEKRVCYAPSFGFSKFQESDCEFHKEGLAGFERLSCREQEMIPMIQDISGKTPQLVLDPTLLLDVPQWRKYAAKPDYDVPEKYILCYFIGNKTPEYTAAICEAAGGLPVISVYEPDEKRHWATDPGAFLWLFDHADFVCTDSFHGTAFSVNFGKNFLAFIRNGAEDMFGRISGLLDSLNITGHIYEPGMKIRPEPVNYDEANAKLNALRESSMNYLRECLK